MSMRAAVLKAFGSPLEITEIDVPSPAPGQVLVQVKASGVIRSTRRSDWAGGTRPDHSSCGARLRHGRCGRLRRRGTNEFRSGDEVFGMTGGVGGLQGTLAEFAAVDARLLAPKPDALSMAQAAALPLAFITAWEALIDHADVS
jgi:NADPH:quinone reductase